MRALISNPNVDSSDLANYPDGRVKNNTGGGNGTPVNENVYGDLHQTIAKAMRLYGITPNNLPDNETNNFQIIEAFIALASKNDFVLPLGLNAGVLSVPIKLGFMLENESIVCKASFDLAAETQIKGSDNVTYAVTFIGSFKTNEYVRVIKDASGVTIVRLADNVSLNDMVANLLYLKKATQPEEDAGIIDTKATTPLTNLLAFVKRVNGTDSNLFLATLIRDGLYPKEHFALVNGLGKLRNVGTLANIDVDNGTDLVTSFSVTGDLVSAILQSKPGTASIIRVTVANAMSGLNYYVKPFIQAQSVSMENDGNISPVIFKQISSTTFDLYVKEFASGVQNLKIYLEVVNI